MSGELTPEAEARIDAKVAMYEARKAAGECYACGTPNANWRVTLPWMGEGGRLYCRQHAAEWAHAGYPKLVNQEATVT